MDIKFLLKQYITFFYGLFLTNESSKEGFRVFMYHSVGRKETQKDIYSLTKEKFQEQMLYLKNNFGENIYNLREVFVNPIGRKFVITFDDGYKDNLLVVAPIMAELNLPYTVFITTDYIQEKNIRYLSTKELKDLSILKGVDIGSHTKSHPRLTGCNDKKIKEELEYSKKYLEDLIGKEVNTFAYPHGDYNDKVKNMVGESGYKYARTSRFSICDYSQDKLLLNSTEIWDKDNIKTFRQKIEGHWDWLSRMQN